MTEEKKDVSEETPVVDEIAEARKKVMEAERKNYDACLERINEVLKEYGFQGIGVKNEIFLSK